MVEMDLAPFEVLVGEALDSIPPELARRMDNVAVVVLDGTPRSGLLGRYEGVPLPSRDAGYTSVAPDRITIFRLPILARCASDDEVREQVRVTVLHEVAHHFGIGDRRLDELGYR